MRVEFAKRQAGPERLVAEVALLFDSQDGVLDGLKLVGFCLWRGADDELRVTLPARSYGLGSERRYFDLLRSQNGTPKQIKALKAWIIQQFKG